MKRVLTIIGCILMVLLTCGVVVGVLFHTGILGKEVLNKQTVFTYSSEDGRIYTEATWDWKPAEYKGKISYVDTSTVSKQVVTVHLSDNIYYDITLPVSEYIYDYGKTIWAIDGSYMVRVVANATLDNLASLAGIDNGESLNQITLTSKEGRKGARTIVTLVDSYAIIANVYFGDEVYSTLCDSLSSGATSYEVDYSSYIESATELEKLTYVGNYVGQVIFQEVSLEQKKYMFEDGTLWVSSSLVPLYEAKDTYINRMCVASGQPIDEVYDVPGMFYAKSGDYYLGLISYNSNTTIVLLGDGEESKCNIISVMKYLK